MAGAVKDEILDLILDRAVRSPWRTMSLCFGARSTNAYRKLIGSWAEI